MATITVVGLSAKTVRHIVEFWEAKSSHESSDRKEMRRGGVGGGAGESTEVEW
jgi:hypothetical protein